MVILLFDLATNTVIESQYQTLSNSLYVAINNTDAKTLWDLRDVHMVTIRGHSLTAVIIDCITDLFEGYWTRNFAASYDSEKV